VQLNNSCIC